MKPIHLNHKPLTRSYLALETLKKGTTQLTTRYKGNLWLCWQLMFSEAGRAWYRGNGSFGLTNDYIRVAQNVLGCSLESVAALMFVVALAVLPLSLLITRFRTAD